MTSSLYWLLTVLDLFIFIVDPGSSWKKIQLEFLLSLSRKISSESLSSIFTASTRSWPGLLGVQFPFNPVKSHQVIYSVNFKLGAPIFYKKILFQVHWLMRSQLFEVWDVRLGYTRNTAERILLQTSKRCIIYLNPLSRCFNYAFYIPDLVCNQWLGFGK